MNYEYNIQLERRYSKIIKAILGNQFITQNAIMDRQEGTDFAILTVKPFKVGVRLRRYKYYQNPEYRKQFTIRWALASGKETEIDKIRAGFVNYLLYGFVDEAEKIILQYFIGNLFIFRQKEPKPYRIYSNKKKGDSDLAVYRISDLDNSFITKRYGWGTE